PELHREAHTVKSGLPFAFFAVKRDDVVILGLERITQGFCDIAGLRQGGSVRVHLHPVQVDIRWAGQRVFRRAVDDLPDSIGQPIARLAGLRRSARHPEPGRVAPDQAGHGRAIDGDLENRGGHSSFLSSLSTSFSIPAAMASNAGTAASLAACRMKGCARASLVPNPLNRQWVVFPTGRPVGVPFLSGRAPPSTPTRIIGPPAERSRRLPPEATAMFSAMISRVSGASIRLASALARSRITFAPRRRERRMA